ncbi:hypothetical protein [Klebsiella sp. LTGPAF-6F]|uniref:hypothetical protein n=1 Tax=Klebsiella sp. LTGPAF-6F TaxID=1905288 RepID=UPI00098389F5|nr:hypothetical protein [Klebsiella sp. LTGPAF-6F]
MRGSLNPALCYPQLLVVILVVLTERQFRFSLNISQLLAKAIPVRGAKFKKPAFERAFCFLTLSFQPDRLL